MNFLTSIIPAVVPIAQIYLLFKIWRELKITSADAVRREELKDHIKKFGQMFAEAAEVPKPPRRLKVVETQEA